MVAFGERNIGLEISCNICGIVYHLFVHSDDIERYGQGDLVQDAFPYLSANERELIISHTCGSCFDKIFG